MEYFKKYFRDVDNWDADEVKVCCPFHQDTNPSASINTQKSLFHCFTCNIGYNEEQFVAKVNNISTSDAIKLLDKYTTNDSWDVSVASLWSDVMFLDKLKALGLGTDLITKMRLGVVKDSLGNKLLGIPVFYNNILVDIRRYNLLKHNNVPKMMGNEGATTGWIIPYDEFISSDDTCYIFEGEKDMLMAREQGINAYTLTGGAGASPNGYIINAFKNKNIILCYDNDDAGVNGMNNMFSRIKDIAKDVKYIDISDRVSEVKEDFSDYITKYDGNIYDFYTLEERKFDLKNKDIKNNITIKEALRDNKFKKLLRSEITITSEFSDSYSVPTIVKFVKTQETKKKSDVLSEGEELNWYLEDDKIVQLLELIEVCAKDYEVNNKLKSYVGIPSQESYVDISCKDVKTIYKSTMTDKDIDGSAISLDLYSFEKLDVGGQYSIEYRIFSHPTKNQKLVAICKNATILNDSTLYNINKDYLKMFQSEGTVEKRLDRLYNSAKYYIAKHLNFDTWLMTDLVFNSILDFDYDVRIRGALDVFFLGDTQVGKSETTSKECELYNFGHFLSLKTSTTVGLIGGSSKVDGSYCNTIGAIPRQHKRLVVLEEFSGADSRFIKTMTDIRSSNELRLSRVSGELIVPCKLRMITISNPLNDENGNPRFLDTFPNGVMPIMELIKSAEDVARYDGFLLIPKVKKRNNPFGLKLSGEKIDKEAYENKVAWITTRKPENVIFDDDVKGYIWEKAEELNKKFECNFPLFGTTTDKKLARFCVALATLLVNTDETYENVIVTKDIVDYIVKFLNRIYDNETFKLKNYADEYKEYSICSDKDIKTLESLYTNNSTLINFLVSNSKTSRANLSAISGKEPSKFSVTFNNLVKHKFIRLSLDNVMPTDKLRQAFKQINKDFTTDDKDSLIGQL